MPLVNEIVAMQEELTRWRRDIHAHPELGFEEARTAAFVANKLQEFGLQVHQKIGKTGVVGVIKGSGDGPSIGLRADMDALPIDEMNDTPWKSQNAGVMHACGHDMHVTSLVGTTKMLMDNRDKWSGTVMLVGQPAEEIINGAKAMLDDGLYERFGVPDYALGLHVSSGTPSGTISIRDGIMYSSVDSVDIQVRGIGGHGAYPQQTVDPIYVASQLVIALQGIISRKINPFSPAVITVGSFQGGNKHNIISDEVNLQLTVRTDSEDVREQVLGSIRDTAFNIGRLNGLPLSLIHI